jgi:hypothetical protein
MMNQIPKRSNTARYIVQVHVIIIMILSSGLTYQYTKPNSPSPSPTSSTSASGSPSAGSVTITIYAGETNHQYTVLEIQKATLLHQDQHSQLKWERQSQSTLQMQELCSIIGVWLLKKPLETPI